MVHLSDFCGIVKVLAEEREGRQTNAEEDSMERGGGELMQQQTRPLEHCYRVQEGDSYGMWGRLGYPGRAQLSSTPASASERS